MTKKVAFIIQRFDREGNECIILDNQTSICLR